MGDEDTEQPAAIFAELAETDPDIIDQLGSDLLLMIGYALLIRSEADTALAVFARAYEVAPAPAAPLLGMARAWLYRGGVAHATVEVSSTSPRLKSWPC